MAPPPPDPKPEADREAPLEERLAAVTGELSRLEGLCFRIVPARYEAEILSVEGSRRYGGRYNPKGEFGVLYLAEGEEVARAEVLRKVGEVPDALKEPRICGAVRVRLTKVLDLTDERILKGLGIRWEDLLQDTGDREKDYGLPRRVARAARAAGFEALRVPSVTSKGNNLVLFPENLSESSQVQVERKKPISFP